MCGIFGYVCRDNYEKGLDIAIPIMAVYMESRGSHSWGFSDGVEIIKDTGGISNGLNPSLFGRKQAFFHTRHATTGSHTKENAHPWTFEKDGNKLVGMHNGIITNDDELNNKYSRKFEVDSMHIFQHIVENRPMKEIRGYGAVVYCMDGQIYLGRFNGGQLAVARTKFGTVFASTQETVNKAMKMAGLDVETFYQVDDEKLYVIQDANLFTTEIDFHFGSRYEPTKAYGNYSGGYMGNTGHDWRSDRHYWKSDKGRWINDKFEPGRFVNDMFVHGTWDGDKFTPELRLITDGNKRKESKKDKRKNNQKVIVIDSSSPDACVVCKTVFSVEEETWETPVGEMCDTCCEAYYRLEEKAEEDRETVNGNTIEKDVKEKDNPFIAATVREYLKNIRPNDVTIHTNKELESTACDECSKTLIKDDLVYLDKQQDKVRWVLCSVCHTDLTTPYNTNFNFPSA
jgi:Glutamine amidotransferase domain